MTTDYRRIPVSGEGFKPYDVIVGQGLLSEAETWVGPFLTNKRVVMVTDSNVGPLHAQGILKQFEAAGHKTHLITVPAGETSKSFDGLKYVIDAMIDCGLDRKDVVIALGGGVIGDLTGFACAIYMRGIDFIQMPTSVLAQVDSSVGGKTAIDHERGKNLIGSFWQPRLVLCDLDVLKTLPVREIRCGYAEIIKYGLLGDRDFFTWLEANDDKVLALEPDALLHAIGRSVEMKAEIVAQDEREGGVRALLNLGHTFGHALEAEVGFGDQLLHGEAVAIGMCQAFRYSALTGECTETEEERAVRAIAHAGLPTKMSDILWQDGRNTPFNAARLLDHMGHDKKAEGGDLTFVLVRGIGRAFVAKKVARAAICDFLIMDGAQLNEDQSC
ncbi:3-dehydroquinate synthase [Asticcacaulis sp. EMRT-3]|uniref:3-dehydroquinate synthase n=1 Tax=Asticcacaulis sp. EMRT-3 TaxID=3040349 RepID=UPI0024AEC873|nr:3-dehydroquinate synthase [Asticcacaulis sp. EMRT-3]MDI7774930.1 3-dehydroquinate synthase [Asticcacaulis sp. EMRT-3]